MSDNAKIEFTKMRLRRMTHERDDFRLRLFEEKNTVKNLKMQMETLREELKRIKDAGEVLIRSLERMTKERDEARAELSFIQAEYAAANESDLTRDALCLQVAALKHELRMATERAAIACRERDEAVALNQAMSRVLAEYRDGYVYCEQHGHEQQEPCPQCAEEKR